MAEEGFKRKLTAILSADAVDYSRLMGEDEEATVRTLNVYREVFAALIQQHNGHVLDSTGDNLLAEFASVVDAVQCAVAVQKEIKARNDELPENRRMQFRIGINLGDVIQEKGRIYGDGVNIAARLEGLAEPGGICISKTAFDHIESKLPYGYEFLGDQTVKNIAKPVGAYQVLMEPRVTVAGEAKKNIRSPMKRMPILIGVAAVVVLAIAVGIWQLYIRRPTIEPASLEKMAFPLPEKPSIAVLPFKNLSDDPAQDYIAVGITENIISALSKISDMFVIASDSTSTYRGRAVKIQRVSEELGVRYVLEGSAQKSRNRVRVTAQLIDATTGHYLWSEKYDRELQDLFALQDEITYKIIVELQVKLTEGEQARISQKSTTNLEAWSYANRGLAFWMRTSKENNAKAMELFKQAVEFDPNYVWAWVRLAWTHVVAADRGWSQNPSEDFKMFLEISNKVLAMDESSSDVHALLGLAYLLQKEPEKAIDEGEKAIVLGPTNAQAHVLLAVTMNDVGRFDDAIRLVEKAMRLHPYYPAYYLSWLGGGYRMKGRYEDALKVHKQLLDRSLKGEFPVVDAHLYLVELYTEIGREDEARAHTAEIFKIKPGFSLKKIRSVNSFDYQDPALLERRLKVLRKAGIPEHPLLKLPDKPSIAVLAFDNLSGDPEQEYFSDGLSEEIITALSKITKLFVIARHSSFSYKGKPVQVKKVAEELGVRYVLEGSVRKAEDRVRITAQLIDALDGHHLWAERYDRDLKDIFAVQDEITKSIIVALQVKLTEGKEVRFAAKGTNNLQAYLMYLQANELVHKHNPEDNALAKKLAEEAVALDPEYASAYYVQSKTHILDVWLGTSKSPGDSMAKAMQLLKKSIVLNDAYADAHAILGWLFCMTRQYDKALAYGETAVALNPNSAESHMRYGKILTQVGKYQESIQELQTAIRLNPIPPNVYLYSLGIPYCLTGQYDQAITWCERAVREEPNALFARLFMAWIYSLSGRDEEAQIQAAEVLRIHPKFSLENFAKSCALKEKIHCEQMVSALRRVGLK